jgi:hypothetical protein
VRPIGVLNKDECRARSCRQTRKQRAESFLSSGRGSDAYNWYRHSKKALSPVQRIRAAIAVYSNTLESNVTGPNRARVPRSTSSSSVAEAPRVIGP